MKNLHIILFMVSIFIILGLVCYFIPPTGFNITLRFPKLEELIGGEVISQNVDENLENVNSDFVYTADLSNDLVENVDSLFFIDTLNFYQKFDTTSVARIYFPDNDKTQLLSFFETLEQNLANNTSVHILHYGDSQIEMDRITGYIRHAMQDKFGGTGVGMLPIVPLVSSYAVRQTASIDLTRYVVTGTLRQKTNHNRYGILAQMTPLNGTVTLNYTTLSGSHVYEGTKTFSRVKLFVGNNAPSFKATLSAGSYGSAQVITERKSGMTVLMWDLPSHASSCSLKLSGTAELYGVSLESPSGVMVDNIALRGSSGVFYTSISNTLLRESMEELNVPMIILEFGGNSVPAIRSDKNLEDYKRDFGRQVRFLHNLNPDAFMIVIGPSDMSTKVKGKLQTYPRLEAIIEALKEASLENGAAYWDMYQVMGGENSMIQWVKHQPAWAASDYIHFTPLGAQQIAEVFVQSFMHYYDYYKFVKRNEFWFNEIDSNQPDELCMEVDSLE